MLAIPLPDFRDNFISRWYYINLELLKGKWNSFPENKDLVGTRYFVSDDVLLETGAANPIRLFDKRSFELFQKGDFRVLRT